MEVHKMDPSNGVLGRGLKRVDTAFREMTGTSEALNRFAESAAAYRLERLKGASHDEAVRYAKDTLANTQGLYSSTNAAPVFRNPYLRPLLQFKQFPQMMYHLLGKSLVTAFKGETKEIRIEAAKQFAGIVATHALMAGAMGLPLEPIRAGMLVANALGAPGMNWAEHEDAWTKYLAEHVGPQAAEIIMHGITRGLGGASFDAHHRLGQGTLAIGMDPRGDSENDLKAWGWDMALGAPGGMVSDFFQGSKEIAGGHVAKGLETILPLKAAVDPIKAVAAYIGGKKTARGNVITPPASIPQTIMRSLGFTPAAEAQANAATASVKRTQLETGRAKADVIQSYLGGKQSAMTDVVRWNAAHPDNQISYSGLMKARREAAAPQALGQKINKANRSLIDTTSRAYNLGGVQ
jgi:hypothetical protein